MIIANRKEEIISAGTFYGLKEYQINFCVFVENEVGFNGLDVLEVGGHLPKEFVLDILKVNSWIALEEPEYWRQSGGIEIEVAQSTFSTCQISQAEKYVVLEEGIENLPSTFYHQFDLVFSIAAFQHILRFGPALFSMFNSLRTNGRLLSGIGPIWGCSQGHLLRPVLDSIGREIHCSSGFIPPWGHLVWSPAEFHLEMCKRTDRRSAGEIAYEVFSSNRLNRFFLQDYIDYISQSPFRESLNTNLNPIAFVIQESIPNPMEEFLRGKYPGYKDFNITNFTLSLERV